MGTPDLREFERIVFFTGAGVSAESGIPTYRGQGGIWGQYNYEDYACQRAFDRDPEKVWEFHEARRKVAAECRPNPAHLLIAAVARELPGTRVITQNIDGLHQRAGSQEVIELHGSLWRVRCDADNLVREDLSVPLTSRRCGCGDYWRPDLVWFEDPMKMDVIDRAVQVILACDCLVSVGTSAVVYPAAELPLLAMNRGATTIEVNPDETPVSRLYHHCLRGKAGEILPRLWGES